MLQKTSGHTGGTSTTITKILKGSSLAARGDNTVMSTVRGYAPWCNLSLNARGVWRGLFMVSCSPANMKHLFEAVKALVQNNVIDFVLAFGGSGTLPFMISNTIHTFIAETSVFGQTNVCSAVCNMVSLSFNFLDYTTAVVVFTSIIDNRHVLECRQIGKAIAGDQGVSQCQRTSVRTDEDNKHFKKVNVVSASEFNPESLPVNEVK
ncbi:hypothetical protein DEU56DRAFT_752877 [Suillus clintonianus]|uniref:uncharacterized protein n=1 Tax=Suillus clintonianus TaxID=1904413 RepID=UPI001B864E47|nr:uncharacterized protein DEU56DRAFT_752877 [Suillus clintonianus]KAG2149225.1 hypothetical protein DEU56DRAFT_752877 [Suillus clintonianus]